MGRMKDCKIRVNLPWVSDPREARRLYMKVWRSKDPEKTIEEIRRGFNGK